MDHVVERGDTLFSLGRRYGVPWRAIADANGLGPPYGLRVGARLHIPRTARPPAGSVRIVDDPEGYTMHRWRRREPVRWIVMHDPVSPSDPYNTLRFLRKNTRGVSYDYLVVPGSPPEAHRLVPDRFYCGHAGYGVAPDGTTGRALNRASVGVSIYKTAGDGGPFPADLVGAAATLVALLCQEWGLRPDNVLAHREVDPHRRSDPRGLSMTAFRDAVAARLRTEEQIR